MLGMSLDEDHQINNTPDTAAPEASVPSKLASTAAAATAAAVAVPLEETGAATEEHSHDQNNTETPAKDDVHEDRVEISEGPSTAAVSEDKDASTGRPAAPAISSITSTTPVTPTTTTTSSSSAAAARQETGADEGKSTALVKEQLKYCATILKGLKRHPQSPPFQLPVDPVALNIPDYFDIIKNPMDLSTITKKLESGEYADADAFVADVRLMLSNCFTYNHPESQVTKMGKSLEKYFNGAVAKIPQSLSTLGDMKNRRKSEPALPPPTVASQRVRRESHAPPRLASVPAAPSPRGRSRTSTSPEMAFCNNVMRELLKKTHQAVSWPFMEPVDPIKLGIPDYFDVIKHPMDLSTVRRKLETGQYSTAEQFAADVRVIFTNCYTYNAADSDVVNLCRAFEKIFEAKWAQKPASFAYPSVSSFEDSDSDSEKILEINQKIQALQQELNTLLMKRKGRSHSASSSSSTARPKKAATTAAAAAPRATPKATAAPSITEEEFLARPMSFEEKRQLSIEVNNLSPERLGRVVEIIQAGTSLEAQGDSDVIELDIESLNTRTLRQLQKYVMECKGVTSLAVILGETSAAPTKRKKPSAPSSAPAPKKPNAGGGAAASMAAPSPAAAAAVAMSTDEESSEDDLD